MKRLLVALPLVTGLSLPQVVRAHEEVENASSLLAQPSEDFTPRSCKLAKIAIRNGTANESSAPVQCETDLQKVRLVLDILRKTGEETQAALALEAKEMERAMKLLDGVNVKNLVKEAMLKDQNECRENLTPVLDYISNVTKRPEAKEYVLRNICDNPGLFAWALGYMPDVSTSVLTQVLTYGYYLTNQGSTLLVGGVGVAVVAGYAIMRAHFGKPGDVVRGGTPSQPSTTSSKGLPAPTGADQIDGQTGDGTQQQQHAEPLR